MFNPIPFWLQISVLLALSGPISNNKFDVEKLDNLINTAEYDETNPVVSLDGRTIYFTRVGCPSFDKTLIDRDTNLFENLTFVQYNEHLKKVYSEINQSPVDDPVNSNLNQDIWVASITNGKAIVSHPGYPVNSALPNSVCSLTPDDNTLVIVNQFHRDGSMAKGFSMINIDDEGNWGFPQPMEIQYLYTNGPDINLNMSSDGEAIILAMNNSASSGDLDLFVSHRINNWTWSKPAHLGNDINTKYRESTPYLSENKKYMFFSSNRPGGMGGNDIYVSQRLDDTWTRWTKPLPLLPPINSAFDDSQPFFNERTGFLFFTSRRDGSSDIFKAKIQEVAPEAVKEISVKCKIIDAETKEYMSADLEFHPIDDKIREWKYLVTSGSIRLRITENRPIKITVSREGYRPVTKVYDPSDGFIKYAKEKELVFELAGVANSSLLNAIVGNMEDVTADTLNIGEITSKSYIPLSQQKIELNSIITLPPIFFVRSKDEILSDSYNQLNLLADFLEKKPGLQIQINGYTDNVGDKEALYKLSADRATAIKRYLVKRGIESYRITTQGFGASQPKNDNSTEALKKENRRVEFVVTKL